MINEIKSIVRNYLNNANLCAVLVGTVTSAGVNVSDKLTLPLELISGTLKGYISSGDKVKLIRNHGGQEYYIVEIIGLPVAAKNRTLSIEPITVTEGMTISSIKIKDVIK
ncbi:MAG: DNA helicase [Desulfitobacterium sp.]